MAGYLLPLFLDLLSGGAGGQGGTYGPSELSASAQDTSADSNVFNTQGPSANHGSISFNFNVNPGNLSKPWGNTVTGHQGQQGHQGHRGQPLDEVRRQNEMLKQIIGKIAPSIIAPETRTKRSAGPRRWFSIPRSGSYSHDVRCFRPSPFCSPRGLSRVPPTTTTPRPFAQRLPSWWAEEDCKRLR